MLHLQRKGSKSKYKHVKHPEVPKAIKEQTPIISCKRKEFNFYKGQTYSKYVPIPLATKGWHHYKSKGDYFFIHPLTNVRNKYLLMFCYVCVSYLYSKLFL